MKKIARFTWLMICTVLFCSSAFCTDKTGTKSFINCSSYGSFFSCVADPGTIGKTLLINKVYSTEGLVLKGRGLEFTENGQLTITTGTIVHEGAFTAPLKQVFFGTGGVVFGQNSGVREVYPQWFGLSTLSADNTAALQKSLDSLPYGGTVKLSGAGIYRTGRIFPRSGVNLIGDSWDVVLKLRDGQNTDLIREEYTKFVNDIRISGFSIDGNKANNPYKFAGTAIQFGGKNIVIDNMNIFNTAAAGIILGVPTGGGGYTIRNNNVLNPSVPDIGWGGIAITGGEDAIISDNVVVSTDGFQAYGIDLEPNPGWVVKRVRITGNKVVRGRISVGVSDLRAVTESIAVDNNTVDAQGAFGASYDSGSAMYASNVAGELIIRDNVFFAPDQSPGGVRVERTENFTVQNNTVHVRNHVGSGSEIGLWIIDSRYGRVMGNTFMALPGHKPRFGIYEKGKSDYNTYKGNSFNGFSVNIVEKGVNNSSGATLN